MNLSTEALGNMLLIRVMENRIDASVAIQFKDGMRAATDHPYERIVLDLSNVTFLDSSGLGAVVAVMKHLNPARHLELSGLTPAVEKVFRLTRMDSVFTIHRDLPQAANRSQAV